MYYHLHTKICFFAYSRFIFDLNLLYIDIGIYFNWPMTVLGANPLFRYKHGRRYRVLLLHVHYSNA